MKIEALRQALLQGFNPAARRGALPADVVVLIDDAPALQEAADGGDGPAAQALAAVQAWRQGHPDKRVKVVHCAHTGGPVAALAQEISTQAALGATSLLVVTAPAADNGTLRFALQGYLLQSPQHRIGFLVMADETGARSDALWQLSRDTGSRAEVVRAHDAGGALRMLDRLTGAPPQSGLNEQPRGGLKEQPRGEVKDQPRGGGAAKAPNPVRGL